MYSFKEVLPTDLDHLRQDQNALVIDVRTDAEVARGKIEGAMHLPLHLLPLRLDELPKDRPVVFCCQSGNRSGQASMFAVSRGYDNVYNLAGGVVGWARAGRTLAI
jgi:rhodanese-related sulfurtransferase